MTAAVVNCGVFGARGRAVIGRQPSGDRRNGDKDEQQSLLHVLIKRERRGRPMARL